MHAPAVALAWSFWARHRIEATATAVYLLGLVALVHLAPDARSANLVGQLTIPLWIMIPYVIAAFSYGHDAVLEGRDSGFPRRLLTLPISSQALVGWPLLAGAAVLLVFWLVLGGLILRGVGLPAPLLWVPAFLVALLAATQAVTWYAFPWPFLRLVVALPLLGGIATLGMLGWLHAVEPILLLAFWTALIPVGYLVAVAGVTRARRGEVSVRPWPPWRSMDRGATRRWPSSQAALFWLEWRRHGFVLPTIVGVLLVPELLTMAFASDPRQPEFQAAVFLVTQLVMLPFMGAWAGGVIGHCDPRRRKIGPMPAFIAVRPVSSVDILNVKLRVAVWSTLSAWLLAVATMAIILPYAPAGRVILRWARQLLDMPDPRGTMLVIAIVIAWPLLVLKAVVNQLWIGLSGREWVVTVTGVLAPVAFLTPALLVWWLDPDPGARGRQLLEALPWLVAVLLLLKLGGGLIVIRTLVRRATLSRDRLVWLAGAWGAAALSVVGLALWLVPADVAAPWFVAAAALVCFLPVVRLGLAPLVLDWNRHR